MTKGHPATPGRRTGLPWGTRLLWALGYVVAGLVGALTRPEGSQLALLWPAAGVALLWMRHATQDGRRPWWDGALLAVVATALNDLTGLPLGLAVGLGLVNTVQGLVGAAVLLWARRRWATDRRLLCRYAALILAVLAGAATSAPIMVLVRALVGLGGEPWWEQVVSWTTRNAVCSAVVATAGMALVSRDRHPVRRLELAAFWVVAAGLHVAVFMPSPIYSFGFFVVPVAVWAGLRLGWRTTALAILASAVLTMPSTLLGHGPFGDVQPIGLRITVALSLIALMSAVGMVLALMETERDRALTSARDRELRLRQAMDSALIGTAELHLADGDAVVVRVNPALAGLFEVPVAALVGRRWLDLVVADQRPVLRGALTLLQAQGCGAWEGTVAHRSSSGAVRWCRTALAVVPTAEGPTTVTLQLMDTTASKDLEDRLRHLGLHDELTGLPNRALLADRVEHALAASRRTGRRMALLFFDLDHFKNINDSLGHPAGDATLVAVAERLQAAVRPGDTVARIGGDEFVVCCPDVDDVARASDLVQRLTASVTGPFRLGTRVVPIGVSAGITLSHPDSRVEDLIRESDSALYEAKNRGRGRAEFYAAALQVRAQRHLDLKADLQRALERGEFVLHYQPIVDLDAGRIVALEALVRWRHPTRGLLLPEAWLDVAESSGPMTEIGRWVLQEACEQALRYARLGGASVGMHVNLSARQLQDATLCATVTEVLRTTGLPADQLVLELTETHLLQVTGAVMADLERVRRLGVRLSADDFGTGYSSLTQLIQLPVDELKIDKSFVQAMGSDPRAHAIVHGVIGMASAMGLAVVAEGVETQAVAASLRQLSCSTGQGYLWSRPRPPEAIRHQLQEQAHRDAQPTP